jgi:hypothetical protein
MALSIQQLTDDGKFSHALRLEVLEQVYPRELVSELLTRCHAWGERERSLNQLLLVYYVIALSLCAPAQPRSRSETMGTRIALVVAKPISATADCRGVSVSSSATGLSHHASLVPARLPPNGD